MVATEVRCKSCNRWLATASVMIAAIKCPRCKMIFEYKIVSNLHMTSSYDIMATESAETTPHKAVISDTD